MKYTNSPPHRERLKLIKQREDTWRRVRSIQLRSARTRMITKMAAISMTASNRHNFLLRAFDYTHTHMHNSAWPSLAAIYPTTTICAVQKIESSFGKNRTV